MRSFGWRAAWVLFILLFLAAVHARITLTADRPDAGFSSYLSQVIVVDLFILVPGLILAALVALVPRASRSYGQRFWDRAPFVLCSVALLVLLFASVSFWLPRAVGMDMLEGQAYADLVPAADCSSMHEGTFVGPASRFTRADGKQIEVERLLGMEQQLEVEWISPCEYRLTDAYGGASLVKILEVFPDGYYCAMVQFPDTQLVMGTRIQRLP